MGVARAAPAAPRRRRERLSGRLGCPARRPSGGLVVLASLPRPRRLLRHHRRRLRRPRRLRRLRHRVAPWRAAGQPAAGRHAAAASSPLVAARGRSGEDLCVGTGAPLPSLFLSPSLCAVVLTNSCIPPSPLPPSRQATPSPPRCPPPMPPQTSPRRVHHRSPTRPQHVQRPAPDTLRRSRLTPPQTWRVWRSSLSCW